MNQSANYEENKYGIESIFDNLLTEYRKLQIHKYGMVYITTLDISEGCIVCYESHIKNSYISHTLHQGFVDLVFSGLADRADEVMMMQDYLQNLDFKAVYWRNIGVDAVIRIEVPVLDVDSLSEISQKKSIEKCLDAVFELSKFTFMLRRASIVITSLNIQPCK